MNVDLFDPRKGAACVFAVDVADEKVVGLLDGSGDWGSGVAAADWTRQALRDRWSLAGPRSTAEMAADLREVLSRIPSSLSDPEFGMSFSAVLLLCGAKTVSAVCSGVYALRLVRHPAVRTLLRPRLLSDDLVANGQMTPEEVEAFPHRSICVGPALGVSDHLSFVEEAMQSGDCVVVSHYLREPTAFEGVLPGLESARQVAASMAEGTYPSPAVLVTW
jgi:hypothetical protein